MPDLSDLITDVLHEPVPAMTYHLTQRLRADFPDLALIEGDGGPFGLEAFAAAGQCTLSLRSDPLPQLSTMWAGPRQGVMRRAEKAWFEVQWQGNRLDVLLVEWEGSMGHGSRYYILAESEALADQFLAQVCLWNSELRDEVLVFEGGNWRKDPALFRDIKGATLDNLILRGNLKREIRDDLAGFFHAADTYRRYGVPWKRGILFVGPPGNGKTHAVKALVNDLGQDCLYVKSFRSQVPDEYAIHHVFARARMTAPCILVLEDLDSLITPKNRSFFLNELDGFAGNEGLLTLATTNHPERLDPAIVDRPSRFDRKYPFNLPEVEERTAYISMWNRTLQPELQLSAAGVQQVAERSQEFSFAYLKELFVSATMRWINLSPESSMDDVMIEQVEVLREQMASAVAYTAPSMPDGMESGDRAMVMARHFSGMHDGGWFSYSNAWEEDVWDDESEE